MVPVLIVLAVVAGCAGILSLSNATMGVGFLAAGCLVSVLARIAQASQHHKEHGRRDGGATAA